MSLCKSVSTIRVALALVMTVVIVGFSPVQRGEALQLGQQTTRSFPDTEFTVDGDFLTFFDTYGGLEVFGYPITARFLDRGVEVQYFQNARFEAHPNNPDPYKVQLGLLGSELNYGTPRVPSPQFTSQRRIYFSETGHIVSYAFLDYFESHGGLMVFGYPISEMRYDENGRIVQYFQRMKLEWHADDRISPVQVGSLGEIYFDAHPELILKQAQQNTRPDLNRPSSSPTPTPTPSVVTAVEAVVSVRYSVMGQEGNQAVSVLVVGNNGTRIHNANVSIRLVSSEGQLLDSKSGLLTNTDGFVRVSFPAPPGQPGQEVLVYADVDYSGLHDSGADAFLLWW